MRNEGGTWETHAEESGWGGDVVSGKMVGYRYAIRVRGRSWIGDYVWYIQIYVDGKWHEVEKHPAGL